jgi:hypothetical protein
VYFFVEGFTEKCCCSTAPILVALGTGFMVQRTSGFLTDGRLRIIRF